MSVALRLKDCLFNASYFSNRQKLDWKQKGLLAGKIACGIVTCAAISAGTGRLLQTAGTHWSAYPPDDPSLSKRALGQVGRVATKAGNFFFLTGKYAFLSIATPAYAILWEVPKWTLKVAIPKIAKLTHKYVLIPLHEKLKKIANAFENIARWTWKTVITPICKWSWNFIIHPVLKKISNGIECLWKNFVKAMDKLFTIAEKFVDLFHTFVVAPLKNITDWAWKTIIVPVGEKVIVALDLMKEALIKIAKTINDYVLRPIFDKIVELCKWSWNIFTKTVEWLGDTLGKILSTIFNRVLPPILEAIVKTSKCLWNKVIVPVDKTIVKLCKELFQRILKPIGQAIVKTAKKLWKWPVDPILNATFKYSKALCKHVIKTAHSIYDHVLVPTGQFIAHTYQATVATATSAITSIYETYVWLTKKSA